MTHFSFSETVFDDHTSNLFLVDINVHLMCVLMSHDTKPIIGKEEMISQLIVFVVATVRFLEELFSLRFEIPPESTMVNSPLP